MVNTKKDKIAIRTKYEKAWKGESKDGKKYKLKSSCATKINMNKDHREKCVIYLHFTIRFASQRWNRKS